ncbi:MAG: hypothetical protein IT576_16400, partial [Verrucomicrobiales bacterium]|nr:hypothetical protein [Verrucomicrobiales bacterium]
AFLAWLNACAEEGGDHRSVPERVRAAVNSAGSRRGLALETKKCYRSWAARYAGFAGDVREIMREETATRFLTSVVEDEDCAFPSDESPSTFHASRHGSRESWVHFPFVSARDRRFAIPVVG